MRTEEERSADIKRMTRAVADAVKALGPYQPCDVATVALGMITVMGEKLGVEPPATMAALLLDVCDGDVRKAIQSVKLSAYARAAVEPVDASEPAPVATIEPLTGGPADINVRVRVKRDWSAGSFMAGQTGNLIEHTVDERTVVRLDGRGFFTIPTAQLERTDECPCCGREPS